MQTTISSESKQVIIGPSEPVVMIGERINPTGRKKLAAALEAGDMGLLQQEAKSQVAAGAQAAIRVFSKSGASLICRARDSTWCNQCRFSSSSLSFSANF